MTVLHALSLQTKGNISASLNLSQLLQNKI